jgi:hypothetical protein
MSVYLLPKVHQNKVEKYYQDHMGYYIILKEGYKNPIDNSNKIWELNEKDILKTLRKVVKE